MHGFDIAVRSVILPIHVVRCYMLLDCLFLRDEHQQYEQRQEPLLLQAAQLTTKV